MSGYVKYKERTPEETVFAVQQHLHEAGLFPVMEWSPRVCKGVCSNRVRLYPTQSLGQNGKGTDETFASASGYAELMERLQNGWLGQKSLDREAFEAGGFMECPDEVKMPVSQLLAEENPYLEDVFARLGLDNYFAKEALLLGFAKEYYGLEDGTLNVLPYVDLFAGKIVHLPLAMVTLFGVSNGMTAGNTLEEAMVQGLSELYERHVNLRLINDNLTPPEIPRAELAPTGLDKLIEKLEEDGRYAVSVRDCSLGEEYPVSCVIITDRQQGTFGLKVGCHPSFAVAVERTLTEAFQGKSLALCSSSCRVGTKEQIAEYHNNMNLAKVGSGYYPPSLFGAVDSWQYHPWKHWESSSNREHLQKLLAHARAHGYRPLIRDNSHLGFPSFHVIIPGIHNIYPISMTRIREFWSQLKAARLMDHFPDLSAEEEADLYKYLRFKSTAVESSMGLVLLHDFLGETMSTERLGAFLALKRGDYDWAFHSFSGLAAKAAGEARSCYECYKALAKYLSDGLSLEEAHHLLARLYEEAAARRVAEETKDLHGLLARVFPAMHCFDCGKCQLAGEQCEYPATKKIRQQIKAAIGRSKVSQEALAEELKQFL